MTHSLSDSQTLNMEDIQALKISPDTHTKSLIIDKLSHLYKNDQFSDQQQQMAEGIFRTLLNNAELELREKLSINLVNAKRAPHDLMLQLAKDVDSVSLPILEFCDVLDEQNLHEIITNLESAPKQLAIARRKIITPPISRALISKGNMVVSATLLENEGAQIPEDGFMRLIQDFPESEGIMERILLHEQLSSAAMNAMTNHMSAIIKQKLERKYGTTLSETSRFFKESHSINSIKYKHTKPLDFNLIAIVDKFHADGQLERALNPSYGKLYQLLTGLDMSGRLNPLMALQSGHKRLFEIIISYQSGVPLENVQKLLRANNEEGLKAIYKKAQLPRKYYAATHFMLGIIDQMEGEHIRLGEPRAYDDLYRFAMELAESSKNKSIHNLSQFVSSIREHVRENSAIDGMAT